MNTGHGHVTPREDGVVARCGGPAICSACALEYVRKYGAQHAAKPGDAVVPVPPCGQCGRFKFEHYEVVGILICPRSVYTPET